MKKHLSIIRLLRYSYCPLILMWVYSASSKLMDLNGSLQSLYLQPIPHWMAEILLIQLPLAELTAAMLLIVPVTRKCGYQLSLALLSIFSLYIVFIKVKAFERVPCSCGGIIDSLNWTQHLILNLLLLALNVAGLFFHKKRRDRQPSKE